MFFKRKEPIVEETYKSDFDDNKETKKPDCQVAFGDVDATLFAHMYYNRILNGNTAIGFTEDEINRCKTPEVKSKREIRNEIKDKLGKLDTWDKDLISDINKLVSKL